jgi:hypothetical protein
MIQQVTITGTDMYGNEISEQFDVPEVGERAESITEFITIKGWKLTREDDNGHVYIERSPTWISRKLWNLRCRIYWLFHKHEDDDGEWEE